MKISLILAFLSMFVGYQVSSQTREELETRREEKLKELEYTNQLLKQTERSRTSTIQKAGLISQRINIRQSLILGIGKEIELMNARIAEHEGMIEQLSLDLERARMEYGQLIYFAFKHREQKQKLLYVLAAEDFNQAYRRIRYFQQISQFRKKQIDAIREMGVSLANQIEALQVEKGEKVKLLEAQKNESKELLNERNRYRREIDQLSRKESQLRKEINNQRKAAQALEDAIKRLIAEEARRVSERKEIGLTPEEKLVGDNFRINKGRLPWPTERGVITGFFGQHPHPVLRGIKIQNNGVDILTTENSEVRTIFRGEVRKVLNIPGMNRGVIIRHGHFLSVYTNLSEVFVKVGDLVETRQRIGKVFTDVADGNKSVLHLEIWEENNTLDPLLWIGR
jgi:murein hydrolase activator